MSEKVFFDLAQPYNTYREMWHEMFYKKVPGSEHEYTPMNGMCFHCGLDRRGHYNRSAETRVKSYVGLSPR